MKCLYQDPDFKNSGIKDKLRAADIEGWRRKKMSFTVG